jgi:hypothetical protein
MPPNFYPQSFQGQGLRRAPIKTKYWDGVAYLSDRDISFLQIGDAQFEVRRIACPIGGGFWLVVCPRTRALRRHLFLDPHGNVGTRDSLDLTYASRRMIPRKRKTWARVKAWAILHGTKSTPNFDWFERHPDVIPERPVWWLDTNNRYRPQPTRKKRYAKVLKRLGRIRRRLKQ